MSQFSSPFGACPTLTDVPIPEFIRDLRAHIGHAPLWLPGVSVVVLDGRGHLLLTHRVDTGEWAVPSGILEPGEQPGPAALRELREETGIEAELVRVSSVDVTPPIHYPNGDVAEYLDLCFLARYVRGEARVADDENLAVAWFAPDALPQPLAATTRSRIDHALAADRPTWFAS